MSHLVTAIALACKAHAEQVDKAGAPYILHPLRLMLRCTDPDAQIVAVLHDVVEAVDCMTRRPSESYEDFIERLAPNPLARAVKIQDLLDNLDTTRLPTLRDEQVARLPRYHASLRRLQQEEARS